MNHLMHGSAFGVMSEIQIGIQYQRDFNFSLGFPFGIEL